MIRRFALAAGALLLALLAGFYAAGRGWLGAEVSAGTPSASARPAAALRARSAAQASAAAQIARTEGHAARTKQILFGDFHVHTSFSADAFTMSMPLTGGSGSHTVSDACDFARFCSSLDFWSVNDHAESSSPRRWRDTIEAVRQCDAVGGGSGDADRDLISFLGWEWSHMGTTAENHFGHRNIVLRDLEDGDIPTRPIASDSPAQYFKPATTWMLGAMVAIARDPAYLRFANYQQETTRTPRCPDGVPVRDLPADCREYAATPGELLDKLDDWGHASLAIPHGTTWGMYTPQGSAWGKQLDARLHDPMRQRLVEVYSGHGNTEAHRAWRAVEIAADGSRRCPPPRDDYLPGCWQAGEIIRARCLQAGLEALECDARAATARQRYAEGPAGLGHLSVPGHSAQEWGDAGQCRDCFLPAFAYRPASSVQAMLGLVRRGPDGAPLRFRFGFVGSSDIHTARPGTGYKERLRTKMSDTRMARVDLPGPRRETPPLPESRVAEPGDAPPNEWIERERAGSYYYTGGLVAVHAAQRNRHAIWNALEARETYATSGPRILLWFDLLNPPRAGGLAPGATLPMGSAVELDEAPIFRARAVGSPEQKPGCPDFTTPALAAERLERLCGGECYHPSDTRRRIARIEVVRIRPQRHPEEPLADLIDDPWRSFACEPDPAGCVATFSDPEFASADRDAVYYARAIEEPSPAVNGGQLRCEAGDDGPCTSMQPCMPWAADSDDCLAEVEERAWSSPIFVDRRAR